MIDKNIMHLPYGFKTLMQLSPQAYIWKKDSDDDQTCFGLIAQEAQQVIKEVVHRGSDEEQMLSISYFELIPVILKAIKEQQKIIEDQSEKIEALERRFLKEEDVYEK